MVDVEVVKTINLSKRYFKLYAVESVNLSIPKGCVYGLLGPNGAGKTTTLKLLMGLLHPTHGEIQLFGEPWCRKHLAKVGALIESPALYGHLTGRENLEVHRRLLGLQKKCIDEVLEIVSLNHVEKKKRVSEYSLGMKQRLGIAIALLNKPELIILDEPTNGLDPVGIREMRELIRTFAERGMTVILSSHILSEVSQIVQQVGIISQGQLRYQGSLSQLIEEGQSQDLEELFMKYIGESAISMGGRIK